MQIQYFFYSLEILELDKFESADFKYYDNFSKFYPKKPK